MKYKIYSELYKDAVAAEEAVPKITKLYNAVGINFCIIGTWAMHPYGLKISTGNLDVLVAAEDINKIPEYKEAEIRVLSTDKVDFKDPRAITETHNGIPYISLSALIQLKLDRVTKGGHVMHSLSDVQRLIGINALPKSYADNFRTDIKQAFLDVWAEPVEETDDSF